MRVGLIPPRKKKICCRRRAAAACADPVEQSVIPMPDSTVALPTQIVWTFDQAVTVVSLLVEEATPDVPCADSPPGAVITGTVVVNSNTVTFTVDSPLDVDTRYRHTLTVASAKNPACQTTVQSCFTTAAPCVQPVELNVNPAADSTASPADIVWTFDVNVTVVSAVVERVTGAGICSTKTFVSPKPGTTVAVGAVVTFTPTFVGFVNGAQYRHTLTVARADDPTCQTTVQACFTVGIG